MVRKLIEGKVWAKGTKILHFGQNKSVWAYSFRHACSSMPPSAVTGPSEAGTKYKQGYTGRTTVPLVSERYFSGSGS